MQRGRTAAPTGPQGTREEARCAEGEAHAKRSWEARAGAIGGGSRARLPWRSIVRRASVWVMAALRCRVPRPHAGQRARSQAHTRFSRRAQPPRGEALPASGASTPCWRGGGVMDLRR
jgi:hypothetical protein